jgi:AmmeMemoRadiSam system protein A
VATTTTELSPTERAALLQRADESVRAGLDGTPPPAIDLDGLAPALREPCGTFVTLLVGGALNGCIGTLEPIEPLAEAVNRLAWEAAFRDPRLPALTWDDYPRLTIKISVLSPLEPLPPMTEDELLAALRPGVDGLLIEAGGRRATFLPAVWEQVDTPRSFLSQLQLKAGMRPGSWPPGARASRYTSTEFGSTAGEAGADGG